MCRRPPAARDLDTRLGRPPPRRTHSPGRRPYAPDRRDGLAGFVPPRRLILAAESGPPTCIKRFSATGEFLGVIAVLDAPGDCVRVTVERSSDGSRYYLLDTKHDAIRIFGTKG